VTGENGENHENSVRTVNALTKIQSKHLPNARSVSIRAHPLSKPPVKSRLRRLECAVMLAESFHLYDNQEDLYSKKRSYTTSINISSSRRRVIRSELIKS
jgi:hypothetical protein